MGYIEKSLTTNESILFTTGLHWIVLLVPGLGGVALILLGVLILFNDVGSARLGLALAAVGTFMILLALAVWNATRMAITNRRVIVKVGFFRTKTIEMFLSKIESIHVEQSLLGRMLGYGNIVVRGTGGSAEPFKNIHSPLDFRRQVQQHSETFR